VKELDLHGVSHGQVHKELDRFFARSNFPAIVITGQSRRMKELVSQIALKYGLSTRPSISNPGRLIVHEN
jgi:DNA-nicking Smr family endonuclease